MLPPKKRAKNDKKMQKNDNFFFSKKCNFWKKWKSDQIPLCVQYFIFIKNAKKCNTLFFGFFTDPYFFLTENFFRIRWRGVKMCHIKFLKILKKCKNRGFFVIFVTPARPLAIFWQKKWHFFVKKSKKCKKLQNLWLFWPNLPNFDQKWPLGDPFLPFENLKKPGCVQFVQNCVHDPPQNCAFLVVFGTPFDPCFARFTNGKTAILGGCIFRWKMCQNWQISGFLGIFAKFLKFEVIKFTAEIFKIPPNFRAFFDKNTPFFDQKNRPFFEKFEKFFARAGV